MMTTPSTDEPEVRTAEIARQVKELGPWFHDLDLGGVRTAPDHFLHGYPEKKWRWFQHVVPEDLTGKTVLDVGCNAGFYAFEMARRGAARVLGVDHDEHYLRQARFAAEVYGLQDRVEFRQADVWDLPALGERFDLVIFMGVLYHLRHPLLALDLLHRDVVGEWLLFQTMQRGSEEVEPIAEDYDFFAPAPFEAPGWPKLHFIERKYAGDPTNWWAPNRAGSEAMLRAAGFEVLAHPEAEVFWCRRVAGAGAPDGQTPFVTGQRNDG